MWIKNMKKQPLTLYKFNCGFSTKFQPLSPPQFCTYADWKLPRNPQYKLIILRYSQNYKDLQTAQKVIGRLSLCSGSAV